MNYEKEIKELLQDTTDKTLKLMFFGNVVNKDITYQIYTEILRNIADIENFIKGQK